VVIMEKNFDEVIADMLIQLANIETRREKEDARMEAFDERTQAFDKRLDLTIKRMVRVETRLEACDKKIELLNEKIEGSIKSFKEFAQTQSALNKYFLDYIEKNPLK
jgi:chromosome segregation ATPase